MTRARRYAPQPSTVSLHNVALAIGYKPTKALRLMQRTGIYGRYARFSGGRVVFDQQVIDLLHAVLGQPHRPLEGPQADWLAAYTSGGDAHAR